MKRMLVIGSITAALLGGGIATAVTASGQSPQLCPIGSPCQSWKDQNSSTIQNDLILYDHNGAPIWWVKNAGGMWVGNDKLGVTGQSVFNNAIYMWVPNGTNGALVIDGQTLTASDIQYIHMLRGTGLTVKKLRELAKLVK